MSMQCVAELASYVGMDAINAYADDPNVKFILTERDPDSWVRSFNNTVPFVVNMAESFPMNILKHFQSTMGQFFRLNVVMYEVWSNGTRLGDKGNTEIMRRNYVDYIDMVKSTIPKERLLVIKLEDGLGWEQICPFLEKDIPKEPYPSKNDPKEFQEMVGAWLGPKVKTAALKLGAVSVPILGVVAWAGLKYAPHVKKIMQL